MEEEPSVEWSGLSARARDALEWAAASEVERVVGTRGILFGVSRAAPGEEVDDLLAYFGLRPTTSSGHSSKSAAPFASIPTYRRRSRSKGCRA